ncbi:hypothetical protein QUF84_15970 [Fictibacillus enclensis]|uniref:hypothetical protein n=1 Tax=Fictibacillus enclensis TaxID=1017270 RepID=UPI0025A07FAD|nr:hypothetical protein [Fictibacillus enclensis]MDM5199472.1 hypothetical protein [Fictibacillus enclensis]MDM5338709.1 hypothetical protein [Fictibacillus enclensis]
MLVNERLVQKINQMVENFNISVDIHIEAKCPLNRNIGGKYNAGEQSITLYLEEIQAQSEWLFPNEDVFVEYASVIFAHEAGHATDPYLQKLVELYDSTEDEFKRKKIELLVEVQAWKIAKELVQELPDEFFSKIKRISLEHHYEAVSQGFKDEGVA